MHIILGIDNLNTQLYGALAAIVDVEGVSSEETIGPSLFKLADNVESSANETPRNAW